MRGKVTRTSRIILPDRVYHSTVVTKLIHRIMLRGQKATATTIVYKALAKAEQTLSQPALQIFEQALKHAAPTVEVRSKRIGGATYQVPMEVRPERKSALAMRWIINASRATAGKPMQDKLADQITAAYKNEGAAITKRDEMHRMAEANKAFAHYARF
ncbi:30S ribosomal protein S7 [Candidatus Berkelbacteria bacterium]|nr:30S ribosomal protein S7 [Candidatus Berkelbacteria bacterium]